MNKSKLRIVIAQEVLTTFNDDPNLLKKAIISDESWSYDYDIKTKAQSFYFPTTEDITENHNGSCWRHQIKRFRNVSRIGKNAIIPEADKIVIDK